MNNTKTFQLPLNTKMVDMYKEDPKTPHAKPTSSYANKTPK